MIIENSVSKLCRASMDRLYSLSDYLGVYAAVFHTLGVRRDRHQFGAMSVRIKSKVLRPLSEELRRWGVV